MHILYLAHRIPYPPNKGDKIRSFHALRFLAQRHTVDLACLCDVEEDVVFGEDLRRWCRDVCVERLEPWRAKMRSLPALLTGRPLSVEYFYRPVLQRRIDAWLAGRGYDAVVCFSSPMAEYLFQNRRGEAGNRPVWLMDFCDVDSDKWLQYARSAPPIQRWIYRREADRLLAYEKRVQQRFDACFFVSKREAALFRERVPKAAKVYVAPNGVDTDFFQPDGVPKGDRVNGGLAEGSALVFVGAMDYQPNVDGVLWFAERVFPQIRKERPEVTFWVVGSRPHPRVKALAGRAGIRVTGFVKDVRPYVASAACVVVPLRLARGVQNKVLEAMAMAKPTVVTSQALDGIEAVSGRDVLVEDDERGFAHAVLKILGDPEWGMRLGANARRFVVQEHSWEAGMSVFEGVLTAEMEKRSRRRGVL